MTDTEVKKTVFRFRKRAERKADNPEELHQLTTYAQSRLRRIGPHLASLRNDLPTLIQLARAWANGSYRTIPWKAIVTIIAGLIYFVSPIDAIPDFIPFIGYIDDAAVIAYVLRSLHQEIEAFRVFVGGVED